MLTLSRDKFNLRLWFAICSFGIIVLVSTLSAYWISTFLTHSLLEREAELSQEFLESIAGKDAAEIFDDSRAWPHPPADKLLHFASRIVNMPGMIRVNIHAPNHRILWSTEKQLVGRIFDNNDELDEALRGERKVELENVEGDGKSEHVALASPGKIVEAYIPIRAEPGKGAIVGVVEFYKNPVLLNQTIAQGQQIVWVSAAATALLLFLVLYWIVQRGAWIIERQQLNMARMEAFAAIGQMSGAVAHSLRNPMAAARSSAELWREQSSQRDRVVIDEVIQEIDRMEGYVRDLLSYANAESYNLQPVDPVAVCQRILDKHRPTIDRHKVTVQPPVALATPQKVMADELLLEHALTSIVTNAVEAMPDGGRLSIAIKTMPRGRILIEIADTGHGIPEPLMGRVSESYFTTKARGLGLGLALAKGIIERCQGHLQLRSVPGTGTTVFVDMKSA